MSYKDQITEEYEDWLVDLACIWCRDHGSYNRLMRYLYSREFTWVIDNDSNRAADGKDLRLRFADEIPEYTARDIYLYLDEEPCRVLEMMIALAYRCEDHIMGDPNSDNTGVWFFNMLKTLHADHLTDNYFDPDEAEEIVDRLLDRRYSPDGDGGLFKVNGTQDLRKAEIWYQLNWYLSDKL